MNDIAMEESVSRDRLSELPNSLIHIIYSFLPMRDVVSTTLLSKRWNNLWATTPFLNFSKLTPSDHYIEAEMVKARSFVNRALIFWRGVGILKFQLDIEWDFDQQLARDIDLWLCFAVKNKVEELTIRLRCEYLDMTVKGTKKYVYYTPLCLNSCSSIRELSLIGCNLRIPVTPPCNQLKSLKIDGYSFSERLINRILLGSPQLEVFEFLHRERYENLNIRSTSLKKLKIGKWLPNEHEEPSPEKVADKVLRIRCPNLEILALSGDLYPKYLITDVSSVTDVALVFGAPDDYRDFGNEFFEEIVKQVYTSFQHVDRVTLSHWCVQALGALQEKYLVSSLPNDKFFPNLNMLVIDHQTGYPRRFEGTIHEGFERKLSKSFMLQLKTVDITSSLLDTSTFRFIEFLLMNASMLEKLVIQLKRSPRDWFKVAEELLFMPRSSPTANVILKKSFSYDTDTSF